ncbi:MAG: aldo/keto reductase [Bacillota bacterium]|uniref:Aldo/keto reductase n=1 Tax=Virgibacillus salarius TaxID=447199 RepID=A0A941DX17_9BACI|nr:MULTISPECIES: aldo/keto reductase [Bacillaceae]NAZ09597.1 aldo/keto reductase [Agaribacter marinus]MBR7796887.1 aldo/keto reductase [Virgibacillus salarius]MCC2250651.1 aldo/keto reductase [Virgibacillus sp. AGTR]MDY7046228.1 aldo/keto reductase [Virgibacillus sp. M23]QRZ19560.1 aldo/keto reductase [Virgibacillus sp. AGTR]
MQYITLNNGLKMPQLGFGVWQVPDEEATPAVEKALEIGYRSIDTAKVYENENGVGKALANSNVAREDLFITTKVWNSDQGYENTLQAFDKSLERLGLDYVDLYLIHWPTPEYDDYVETYKALEKLYKDGRVKAIGVCNFNVEHLQRLIDECDVVPAVNQVECHPYLQQKEVKEFCEKHNIYLEAWSPLMQGGEVLKNDVITSIAGSYSKTPAQVILRWHLQYNNIVIPKSVTPSRMEENFNVFDFELTTDDMKRIEGLDRNERKGPEPSEMNIR